MLIVRKPFDFELEEKKIHPEHEEKPVVEPESFSSEDFHGGNEITFSMPNTQSISSSNNNQSQNNEPSQSQDSQSSEGAEEAEISEAANEAEAGEEASESEADKNEGESKESNSGEEVEDIGDNREGETEESVEDSDSEESKGSEDSESIDSNNEISESDESGEEEGGENIGDNNEASESEEVGDNEESEEADEESEEDESQTPSTQYNVSEVVDVAKDINGSKYYQTEFYRFIEMIAEEKTKIYDPKQSEEYNIKKLMFRQFERKPLNHYRMSRIKESVVLILDNSGSMDWWAENLQILADLALQRGDVEIYIAPNGSFGEKLTKSGRVPVDHDVIMKTLRGRKIIYVGDFDGTNTPIELSWSNDVIWICPESRYRRFESHSWASYGEEDFRGAFLRVYDLEEMFYAVKKLLSHQYLNKVWIDLHENDEFYDDP